MAEAVDNWDEIAGWWRGEAHTDRVYAEDIAPMIERLLPSDPGTVIELGCGEGQWLRWLSQHGAQAYGCDRSMRLLNDAAASAAVVCADLPDLSWVKGAAVDTALSVFVLDLVEDGASFFSETARVVREGGSLVVVINHPGFTSPGSGTMIDLDGEVLWRWGSYLEDGSSLQPAGDGHVVFYHRPMGRLLTMAADAGWSLSALEETALGAAAIDREPGYAGQEAIPRFLAVCWRRSKI